MSNTEQTIIRPEGQGGRQMTFDIIKGFAIVLVIMGHILVLSLPEYMPPLMWMIAMVHMPLFAVISGMFAGKPLDLSLQGIVRYWWSRGLRLLLPLLLLPALYQYIRFGELELPLFAVLNQYWFTYALFLTFIVFYLYRGLWTLAMTRWAGGNYLIYLDVALGVSSVLLLEYAVDMLGARLGFLVLAKVEWLYKYLVLGCWLMNYRLHERYLQSDVAGAISGLVLAGSMLYHFAAGVETQYAAPLWHLQTIIATSGFAFVYYVVSKLSSVPGRLNSLLATLGRYSLPIYLTHYFFLPNLGDLLPWMQRAQSSEFALAADLWVALLGTIITLIPTWLVVRWVMTNKYLALLCYGEPIKKGGK